MSHIPKADVVKEARLALFALRLEVPEAVAKDVEARVETAFERIWWDGLNARYDLGSDPGPSNPYTRPIPPVVGDNGS